MQQSATLSNESASQPSPNRPHEPSTRQGARHQIRSNSNMIKSIWEATVLGNLPEPDTGRSIMEPTSNLLLTLSDPPKISQPPLDLLATVLAAARPFHALLSFGRVFGAMESAPLPHDQCRRWECRVLGLALLFPHFPNTNISCKRVDRRKSSLHHGRERKSPLLRRVWHAAHRSYGGLRPRYLPVSHFPVKRLESQ